jgi:hypothetical protein
MNLGAIGILQAGYLSVMARLEVVQPGSIADRDVIISLSPIPDRVWGPSSLFPSGKFGHFFRGSKTAGV